MARPKKHTVDYFPHDCHHSKEVEILINLYGNVGYAFYYRLMEVFGKTHNYTIDCSNTISINYLSAQTGTDIKTMTEMIEFFVDLNVLDQEIWENEKHLWCQDFVNSIEDVYDKRKEPVPNKFSFKEVKKVSGTRNSQSKLNQRKRKKKKKSIEVINEELRTVHCTNGHGSAEVPDSSWYAYYCIECKPPKNAEALFPYYPTKAVS